MRYYQVSRLYYCLYYLTTAKMWVPREWRIIWALAGASMWLIWDLITLYLYRRKIKQIEKLFESDPNDANKEVTRRIISTLHRILVLTIWYNFFVFVRNTYTWTVAFTADPRSDLWIYTAIIFGPTLDTLVFATAMYLMLEHNTSHYTKFIKWVHHLRLYWCVICCECCCCCHCGAAVKEQYATHQTVPDQTGDKTKDLTVSPWDTRDLSVKTKHSQMTQITMATKDVETTRTEIQMTDHIHNNPTGIVLDGIDEHHEVQNSGQDISVGMHELAKLQNDTSTESSESP